MIKRLLALLLALCLLPLPCVFGTGNEAASSEISPEDYAAVRSMWAALDPVEQRELAVKTKADAGTVQAMASAVEQQDLYVEGSLRWNGTEQFTFETTVGVTCGYSARMRNLTRGQEKQAAEVRTLSGREKQHGGNGVYVLQPYYGIDSNFTEQYQQEGQRIAQALDGDCYLYTGQAVTVDVVAEAVEKGRVIIFDSHGDTDYARGTDYTSGATTSYLCLTSGEGLTEADYADDNGTYHAIAFLGEDFYVDGTCIANHMEAKAEDSLIWMAICLSMATEGLHGPLMEQGAGVTYGYSQSVSFGGDYCWEERFWEEMCEGATVETAIRQMKEAFGCWDYSPRICLANGWEDTDWVCSNLSEARAKDAAFPIVVSREDPYPGKGAVDGLQEVNAAWTLEAPLCPSLTYEDVAPQAWYHAAVDFVVSRNYMVGVSESRFAPEDMLNRAMLVTILHRISGEAGGTDHPFADVPRDAWYAESLAWAYSAGVVRGVSPTHFSPEIPLSREDLATMLYRWAKISGETMEARDDLSAYSDCTQIAPYAREAMEWAVGEGLLEGFGNGLLAPKDTATRGQCAKIIMVWKS